MRRRIVHVISSPEGIGGAERVVLDLVRAGRERGWEQLVLHPFARGGGAALAEGLGGITHQPLAAARLHQLPMLWQALGRELRAFQPHVVHAHLLHAGIGTASIPLNRRVCRLWTHHHGSIALDQRRLLAHRLEAVAGRRYDRVVAVSESVARFLVDDVRLPSQRVTVIRNGWQGRPLPPISRSRPPTVISVGMFRPEKDHATLIRAIALVRAAGVPARLVMVGDGPLRPTLGALVGSLGLAGHVTFTGAVGDVWPLLADADVFALASTYETLGIAVMEAMAAGLATVATDVGGLPEVVKNGGTGLLVAPADAPAMAGALIRLLRDEELRARMGAAARERAGRMHAATMVDAYYQLYDEATARRSALAADGRH